jgi:hypothetical protein
MFAGYEGYIAVTITLLCTYLGYWHGKRTGIERALEGMVSLKLLRILDNGEIVAGSELKHK